MEFKEIWLYPKELEQMILGSLSWRDVAERLCPEREKVPEVVIEKTISSDNASYSTCSLIKLEGLKVIILLLGAAFLTMVTWVYFVFYC